MNKLYFGDNLEIMREMDAERVDLIATDPPFNSGRDYNAFLIKSDAQSKAFTDTWTWDTAAQDARAEIEEHARTSDTYKALDNCLKGYDFVLQNAVRGNKGSMRAYLAFMGPRLAEMHRILKDTGSIYLHCDPTASHYLKGVMDAIWDQDNRGKNEFFRNEIVWSYRRWPAKHPNFQRMHDIILRYAKAKSVTWNQLYEPRPASTLKRFGTKKIKSAFARDGKRIPSEMMGEESEGGATQRCLGNKHNCPICKRTPRLPNTKTANPLRTHDPSLQQRRRSRDGPVCGVWHDNRCRAHAQSVLDRH